MKLAREIRARASLEKRALTDAEKEAGYIGAITGTIPYNSDSELLHKRGRSKPFIERIAPGAFDKSLQEDRDIMANAGHTDDPLAAIGRIGENLTVTTSEEGLSWEALVPDTRAGKDLLSLVDKGIIRGTSFEFEVRGKDGERYESRDAQTDLRTITDARLIAFNPVTWPAYSDSSLTVEMRHASSVGWLAEIAAELMAAAEGRANGDADETRKATESEESDKQTFDTTDRDRRLRLLKLGSH